MDIKKLKYLLDEANVSSEQMAENLNISMNTYYRKLHNGKWGVEDLKVFIGTLSLTANEVMEIFFDK